MTDIHIIAPFLDANDGDWRAIDLYLSLYKENNVRLWCPRAPNQAILAEYPINEIKPYQGNFPAAGILYIVVTSTEIGHWYEQAKFERIILIHDSFVPHILYKSLHRLTLNGTRKIEIQYVSGMAKEMTGLPGKVSHPFPHPERFQPIERSETPNQFTVGRISHDAINKHHSSDPDFYRKLSAHGIHVDIVGGTCLRSWLENEENIRLFAEPSQAALPEILNTFDCFYYRTSLIEKDAFEVSVIKAMLSGLPVVCHRKGGYAEVIEHEVNGFLFDTEEEAFEIIHKIRNNTDLRQVIGQKAKKITMAEAAVAEPAYLTH